MTLAKPKSKPAKITALATEHAALKTHLAARNATFADLTKKLIAVTVEVVLLKAEVAGAAAKCARIEMLNGSLVAAIAGMSHRR